MIKFEVDLQCDDVVWVTGPNVDGDYIIDTIGMRVYASRADLELLGIKILKALEEEAADDQTHDYS